MVNSLTFGKLRRVLGRHLRVARPIVKFLAAISCPSGEYRNLQVRLGDRARALPVDHLVDDGHRRLGQDADRRHDDLELALPSSFSARYASFSQASSTSPIPRWTKVVVEPRAPESSTGTFL